MPLILGAQSATGAAEFLTNSCRMDRASSTSFGRTISSDGNLRKWTVNLWVKRGTVKASESMIFGLFNKDASGSRVANVGEFNAANKAYFYSYDGTGEYYTITNAIYRDCTAWYNFHFIWDSDNVTAGDRQRTFVNGVEIDSFLSDAQPPVNEDSMLFAGTQVSPLSICYHPHNNSQYFDGYIAQVIACDGELYLPTKFGEFDSDSPGIWKPIDPADQSLTFGTHGFWLDFKDSADLGADVSGNGNDFTPSNLAAVDQTTDTPVNNFATWNSTFPNFTPANNATYSDGNLSSATTATGGLGGMSTQGSDVSKWYAEIKMTAESTSGASCVGAYKNPGEGLGNNSPHDSDKFYGVNSDGTKYTATVATGSWGASYSAGDVMSLALDIPNYRLYIAKNGLWCDGAGAYDQSSPTAYVTLTSGDEWFFGCGDKEGGGTANHSANFGNPPYTLTSAEADGNGYGAFEYAPPSGYLALCTKNLGSDGG